MSKHVDGRREGNEISIGGITVQDDLKRNPGIGQSKGLEGADPEDIAADTTAEGDTANEVDARTGGIDPKHMGRTNRWPRDAPCRAGRGAWRLTPPCAASPESGRG